MHICLQRQRDPDHSLLNGLPHSLQSNSKPMKIRTVVTAGLLASTSILYAQTYTWRPGDVLGGTGDWNTTTANWNTGPQVVWPSSGTANEAVFDGTAGTVTVQAGGVTANKLTFNTTGYTISGGSLTMNGTTPTFAIGSGSAIINSVIAGSAGFTKSGSGTLTLNGVNTVSGAVNVTGGTLGVFADTANQDGLRFVSSVNIDNATMQLLGTQLNRVNGLAPLTVQNGGVLDAAGSNTNNQHNLGTISLSGGTLTSSGQAVTNGNFVFNGTVTVAGTALSTISASSIFLANTTRTFDVGDAVAGADTAGTDLLISSSITAGGILKTGAGTLRLTSQSNNYSLGTTVNAGTLILDSTDKTNNALGILPVNSNLTISNAAVSLVGDRVNNIANFSGGTVTITSGTLSADQASNNNHHLFNVVLDGGVLTTGTAGFFRLNAGVTVTGTAMSTISAPLNLSNGARTFNVGDAVAGTDLLISSSITAGGILKTGAGTLRLTSQSNNYSLGTTVNAGTLILDSTDKTNNALGILPVDSNLTISNAAVSLVGNTVNNIANFGGGTVTITSGTLSADQASNNNHHLFNVVLDGGVLTTGTAGFFHLNAGVTVTGTAMSTISAPLNLSNGARTFNVADVVAGSGVSGTDLLVSSAITNGGITKDGAGTLRLTSQSNNYSLGTTVNAGTLILDSTDKTNNALGILPVDSNLTISNAAVSLVGNTVNNIANFSAGTVTITSGTLSADQATNNNHHLYNVVLDGGVLTTGTAGFFRLNAGVTVTGTAMSTISAPLNLSNGARTFNVGDAVAGTDLLVSSALSNGSVTKSGLGTMELTGSTSSYAGATTVSAGTLLVNQWLPNSAVTVDGGTLGGTGPIDQLTTIATGAYVAPGNAGIGTLTLQTASLAGTYQCEISGASADSLMSSEPSPSFRVQVAFSTLSTPTEAEYLIATYGSLDGDLPSFTGVPAGYEVDTSTSGMIKLVQSGGAGGFDSWADSWTSPPLSDKTAGGDPDNDGVSNLLEYVLGGDPRVSDTDILPKQKIEGGFLVLSYKRSDASEGRHSTKRPVEHRPRQLEQYRSGACLGKWR
jgi:fibronectin-binding autotransporter adhesin